MPHYSGAFGTSRFWWTEWSAPAQVHFLEWETAALPATGIIFTFTYPLVFNLFLRAWAWPWNPSGLEREVRGKSLQSIRRREKGESEFADERLPLFRREDQAPGEKGREAGTAGHSPREISSPTRFAHLFRGRALLLCTFTSGEDEERNKLGGLRGRVGERTSRPEELGDRFLTCGLNNLPPIQALATASQCWKTIEVGKETAAGVAKLRGMSRLTGRRRYRIDCHLG